MRTLREAEDEARRIVERWSMGAMLFSWLPGSTVIFAGGDMVMVRQVADAFGIGTFNPDALAVSVTSGIGGGVAGAVIAEGVGFIPIIGWFAKAMMMSAKADLIGEAVIDHFRSISPLAA